MAVSLKVVIKKDSRKSSLQLTGHDRALNKWIACVADATRAGRHVINNVAISQRVTRSRTWVSTFAIYTRHLARTFTVTNTLRSTIRWCSNKLWQARARRCIINDLALRIRAARRRLARIYRFWDILRFKIKRYKLLHDTNAHPLTVIIIRETYVLVRNVWTDRRWIQEDRYRLDCDSTLGNERIYRTYQGKDCRISCWCKPHSARNRY